MKTIIIHTITKEEIQALDFSRFENLFGHWPQLWSNELKEKYDSLVLQIDGYNDRANEIYCIPEIRTYLQELHRRWPWWAFFLSNEMACMAICYLCLLPSVESYKRDGDSQCAAAFDPREILEILKHDFGRMNYLWHISGMSDAENDARSDEILSLFTGGIHRG
ncbi:MAG: hypothetical protein ACSHX4_10880 [Opitutaceae bacterium]